MNTDIIRQLLALAETGSYSRAAERSNVTQPAVSLAVKKMERELGVKLFERSGNRYVVTETGRTVLEHAAEMLDAEDRLMSSLEHVTRTAAGRLLVATSNIPGEYVLPLILGDFRADNPDIEPALEVMDSGRVVEAIGSGGFELGFIGSSSVPEHLEMTPFCPDALRVICPTGHPLAENRYVKPSQLADEKFVLREEGSATRDLMVKALREVGLDVDRLRIEMELGSTSAVISAVESGAGISMASQWAVRRPLAEGLIKEIKVVSCRPTRQFGLVRLRKRRLTPQADRFMKFVLRKKSFFKRHASEGPTAGDTRS